MARPRKTDAPDTTQAHDLTAGLIERFTCPDGKQQAFLRDLKAPGLRVRVTANGAKAFTFEGKLSRQTIRRTIGDVRAWSIEQARAEANRLRVLLDAGTDPRELDRQQAADLVARKAAEAVAAATVGEAWATYIAERKAHWGESHHQDHYRYAQAGGEPKKRGKGLTQPGPLLPLMVMRLADLTPNVLQKWASAEGKHRPTVTRNAWRLLRAFLNWCAEDARYAAAAPSANPAKAGKVRETVGKPKTKRDVLQREMLAGWFAAVRQQRTPAISAYLQFLLLTGCRPNEARRLKWADVDFKWRSIAMHDKIDEQGRVIPLPAYLAQVLQALPRVNQYVFASPKAQNQPITEPNHAHDRVCEIAGIPHVTLHGMRRSFKSLAEWTETPTGVLNQIQGHKPQTTDEKHYTIRPLDLLRLHHEKLVAWMLEQAGIEFDAEAEPGKLQLVVNS